MASLPIHRKLARIVAPQKFERGAGFQALQIAGAMLGVEVDPFLSIDHFRIAAPTFPPHAHAGFSAATYVLPESETGMKNRDGFGDVSRIPPGGVHWTAAGSGIVHEEIPEIPGRVAEGMQIFVRQPMEDERAPPRIFHVDEDKVPTAALPGGTVRLLAGRYEALASSFEPPSPLTLLDVSLSKGGSFRWPDSRPSALSSAGFAVYLFSGQIDLGEAYGSKRYVSAPNVIAFEAGAGEMQLQAILDARFLLMAGQPLRMPSYSNGPFVLSSPAALDDAVRRFRSGAMGSLPKEWPPVGP